MELFGGVKFTRSEITEHCLGSSNIQIRAIFRVESGIKPPKKKMYTQPAKDFFLVKQIVLKSFIYCEESLIKQVQLRDKPFSSKLTIITRKRRVALYGGLVSNPDYIRLLKLEKITNHENSIMRMTTEYPFCALLLQKSNYNGIRPYRAI